MPTYKIRQLNWAENGDGEWIAKKPFHNGWYRVIKHNKRWHASGDMDCGGEFKSPGEAMSHCQDHFAAKLMPGLDLIEE